MSVDFTPLDATDDGTTLRLVRPFRWSQVIGRGGIYLLLLCVVALIGTMGAGLALKGPTVGSVLAAIAMTAVLLFTARFLVHWLGLDGVSRAELGPQGLKVWTRVGFGRVRVDVVAPDALRSVTTRLNSAKPRRAPRRVWWLEITVQTEGDPVRLGWVHAAGEADPNPRRAAAAIADRLGVPLAGC